MYNTLMKLLFYNTLKIKYMLLSRENFFIVGKFQGTHYTVKLEHNWVPIFWKVLLYYQPIMQESEMTSFLKQNNFRMLLSHNYKDSQRLFYTDGK